MSNTYWNALSHGFPTNSSVFTTPNRNFFASINYPSFCPKGDIAIGSSIDIKNILHTLWSFITITRVLFALLLYTNFKNAPFIWTLRVINAFRFCTKTMRPKVPPTSAQLFQPLITTSKPPLSEIDIYMHKSNSTYFSDLDIARVHLVCTLFSSGIEQIRGGTSAINRGGSKKPFFGLALGAVSCNFKRELKPYEPYEMWTRVLTWDEKWIYILTHFVKKGAVKPRTFTLYPEQNAKGSKSSATAHEEFQESVKAMEVNPAVVATALSKCVFKAGRKTIPPIQMFKWSGIIPTDVVDESALPETPENYYTQEHYDYYSRKGSCVSSTNSELSTRRSSLIVDDYDHTRRSSIDTDDGHELTEMERIEKERRRGMRAARFLSASGQNALEREFTAEDDALGKHTDGCGVVGVASTLAQLAGLKTDQVL